MSREELIKEFHQMAANLKEQAVRSGIAGPFASWVYDVNGGLLLLDVTGPADRSSAPEISWSSDRYFVTVFSETRRLPMQAEVRPGKS
jgi:hypothetical protein